MKITVRTIYDDKGNETGSELGVVNKEVRGESKASIEEKLRNYCTEILYVGRGLNFYSSEYEDTMGIIALVGINELPQRRIDI